MKDAKILFEFCMQFSLKQLVHNATRGSNILDIVLSNNDDVISAINECLPVVNCDHCIVRLNTSISSRRPTFNSNNNSVL